MKKLTLWQKRGLILGALLLLGLFIWEFVYNLTFFALPVWGLAFLLGLHWFFQWLAPKKPKATKILRGASAVILALCILFFCTVEGFILSAAKGAADCDQPYILVLGAAVKGTAPSRSLRERLEAAKAYLDDHPGAVAVVSGGIGRGESITEAECMFNWLTQQGIDPGRVLMEDKATSTWENLRFTLDLLETRTGQRPNSLAVVSSEYHLYRAGLMARSLGLEFYGIPAKTAPILSRIHYYFREFFGVVHYWVLGN